MAFGSLPADVLLPSGLALFLLLVQLPAVLILLSRLILGPLRQPPLEPRRTTPNQIGKVSVVVPTLNEAKRITPCLQGLTRQGYEVREVIVVDSRSQDGTVDLVKSAQQTDPRFRVMTDDPLPQDWVGRPWALHNGFLYSSEHSEWILGIDADTQPQPGLVSSLIATAEAQGYDLVSASPRFILQYPGEFWLQPALLVTLIYRFGATGSTVDSPERILANGQCFLIRRSLLVDLGGYSSARRSFCDDVTLARYAAQQGAKVGFLDGSKVLKVRMYEGAAETWREWGRSLDLKDASSPGQKWGDLWFLLMVQGLPLIATLLLGWLFLQGHTSLPVLVALGLNSFLVLIRFALLFGIAPTYDRPAPNFWAFWLSPLADPLAVLRIFLSSVQTPTRWRGRVYGESYGKPTE
ncbi:glycosyltransferase [Oscillatoria sp. FACHB-1407]|uniref:2'-O-glycosyltransferase CruG n=1 Tax=Oscillatoria sp. FACHB-1407 TaxID=2692847 RepID=UPI001688BA88|nr:glycosyltransferase family 2 protein [Oscillatoria sp. FACHB-1407]MBD2465951.1 glycosyltransferase [Oscillatoria sp. FACHB-1407]